MYYDKNRVIIFNNKNILCLYVNVCSFILIFFLFIIEIKGDFVWFYNSLVL